MTDKTMLGKVGRCFSVKSGVGHWWSQRVSAVALVPLSIWLIIFLNNALHAPYTETVNWLTSPLNAIALGVWVVTVTYHAALGVQVVIEDYVSTILIRKLAIRITNLIFLAMGVAALAAMIIILQAR